MVLCVGQSGKKLRRGTLDGEHESRHEKEKNPACEENGEKTVDMMTKKEKYKERGKGKGKGKIKRMDQKKKVSCSDQICRLSVVDDTCIL